MAIAMQGSWTVSVKSKSAAYGQRFVISGASGGNGTYNGTAGTSVFVTGPQWSINIQSQAPSQPWKDSKQRITFPTVSAGLVRFDIRSDDTGGDGDYNDLVLTCSMPVSSSEFVVYGNAKTYSGFCRWNPCYPWYLVIDTPLALQQALLVPDLRQVIEKLYPERVPRRPGPNPPPGPLFSPLLIPTGAPTETSGLVFRSAPGAVPPPAAPLSDAKSLEEFQRASVARLKGTASPVTFDGSPLAAGSAKLTAAETLRVAQIADNYRVFLNCDIEAAPGLLLNFQEYDRTSAEKAGGSYTGTGPREALGLAATDEQGNYVFRFSRSVDDFAAEGADIAVGESLATQIFPDVIVQAIGTGMTVDFETAPYFNIPNLKRIDLCLPFPSVHPSVACTGHDRVYTKIGDVIVLNSALGGHPNTLDNGRITCRNANAPQVTCAAWRGGLRVYACFGKPVTRYTMRYKRHGIDLDWQFVNETFLLNYIPDFAPGYGGTLVGAIPASVHVDGGAASTQSTYENHEGDSNWIENDLKLILHSAYYRPVGNPGLVDFRIQGYDAAGAVVAGIDDTLTLYIDNDATTGDIASITLGMTELSDCALFTLTTPDAPLTVKYRAFDTAGFMQDWRLSVTRGNNFHFPVTEVGGVPMDDLGPGSNGVIRSYSTPAGTCASFHGTADEATADADNYVSTTLAPRAGNWLPDNQNFCAFAFTLEAYDRVTDGRNGYPRSVFWQDLIGLSI